MTNEQCANDHKHYVIKTVNGTRVWHADAPDHAVEQHWEAFPDEPIVSVTEVQQP